MNLLKDATVEHIGIAVKDLDQAVRVYRDLLGLPYEGEEKLENIGIRMAFFPLDDTSIEFIEPKSMDSSVGRFIEKRGGGLHHICLRVPDLKAAMEELKGKGIKLADETPQKGARGHMVAFLNLKSTEGVLVELLEEKK